jgi:hypothetical protein
MPTKRQTPSRVWVLDTVIIVILVVFNIVVVIIIVMFIIVEFVIGNGRLEGIVVNRCIHISLVAQHSHHVAATVNKFWISRRRSKSATTTNQMARGSNCGNAKAMSSVCMPETMVG